MDKTLTNTHGPSGRLASISIISDARLKEMAICAARGQYTVHFCNRMMSD